MAGPGPPAISPAACSNRNAAPPSSSASRKEVPAVGAPSVSAHLPFFRWRKQSVPLRDNETALPRARIRVARKRGFLQADQADLGCPDLPRKIFCFQVTPNHRFIPRIPFRKRGGSRSSRNVGWDAVDARRRRALSCAWTNRRSAFAEASADSSRARRSL